MSHWALHGELHQILAILHCLMLRGWTQPVKAILPQTDRWLRGHLDEADGRERPRREEEGAPGIRQALHFGQTPRRPGHICLGGGRGYGLEVQSLQSPESPLVGLQSQHQPIRGGHGFHIEAEGPLAGLHISLSLQNPCPRSPENGMIMSMRVSCPRPSTCPVRVRNKS